MSTETPPYADRIVEDPNIMVGKPTVRGTRIPVAVVLGHLAGNPDLDDLFAAYPRLTIEDVQAVLGYAYEAVEAQRKRSSRKMGPVATSATG